MFTTSREFTGFRSCIVPFIHWAFSFGRHRWSRARVGSTCSCSTCLLHYIQVDHCLIILTLNCYLFLFQRRNDRSLEGTWYHGPAQVQPGRNFSCLFGLKITLKQISTPFGLNYAWNFLPESSCRRGIQRHHLQQENKGDDADFTLKDASF